VRSRVSEYLTMWLSMEAGGNGVKPAQP
jgi:hypothetical protein